MVDVLNLVMLVCAAIGATAFGVLAAYAILRIGFYMMRRPQAGTAPVKTRPEVARIS